MMTGPLTDAEWKRFTELYVMFRAGVKLTPAERDEFWKLDDRNEAAVQRAAEKRAAA
jgi:hypothetical protein